MVEMRDRERQAYEEMLAYQPKPNTIPDMKEYLEKEGLPIPSNEQLSHYTRTMVLSFALGATYYTDHDLFPEKEWTPYNPELPDRPGKRFMAYYKHSCYLLEEEELDITTIINLSKAAVYAFEKAWARDE